LLLLIGNLSNRSRWLTRLCRRLELLERVEGQFERLLTTAFGLERANQILRAGERDTELLAEGGRLFEQVELLDLIAESLFHRRL